MRRPGIEVVILVAGDVALITALLLVRHEQQQLSADAQQGRSIGSVSAGASRCSRT
jgi:hypothetical protein